jgi:class 3 adenylate cyclase
MAEARKTVTVLFADVAGSTALGEAFEPESVRRFLERYFAEAQAAIERHGGTVEKFIGDAVMAVFGVPAVHEDDALRAVRAASELRERIGALNAELERQRGVTLNLRTGVNTGEVVAGDASSDEFYATGDAINVAARLEQAAAPGEILLGEQTYRLVREAVQAEAVEPLLLKGKAAAVPAYRLGLVEEAPIVVSRFDSPFVGRSEELARLRGAFERAVAERTPLLVTVLGPAGIGKTRLAAELTSNVGKQARVLQGRCLSYGEGITFWPLEEILRTLPERPAGLPDPEQARSTEETFWAYRKLFERLAAERPLLLVLEDIHWAEPTLLELLEHVVDWTHEVPLLLFCLARPELLDRRPGWPGQLVELQPLGANEVEALVSALADELSDNERMRITETAEGNPLFAEQMVALALEADGQEPKVPPTIRALLAARLDRLATDERALFECAAVVGKEFWRGAVLELSPPGTEVSAILQRLVRKRLVRTERSSLAGEDAFRFAHILIRDAAYSAIPKERRAALHERFANWLGRSTSSHGEIVGYHLEQAYRYRAELGLARDGERALASQAGTALAQSGLDAFRRGDPAGAANLLTRGLDLLPADAPGRGELLMALGDSVGSIGGARRASAAYESALAAAEAADDRALAWEATLERSALESMLSPGLRSKERYLREAEQAARELEALGHTHALIRAWNAVSTCRYACGHGAAAAEAAERAASLARHAGEQSLERASLGHVGFLLYFGATPASAGIRRCQEILVGTDDIYLRCSMRRYLSGFHAMLGHDDEARRLHELALAEAEDFGRKPLIGAILMLSLGLAETLEPAEAEQKLRRSLALWEEMGNRSAGSTSTAMLARTLCAQGRYDEGERYAAIGESLAAPDDVETHSIARAARAKVLAQRGDLERAESLAREAVAIADRTDNIDSRAWLRMGLADVLGLADKTGEARFVLEAAVELAEQKEDLVLIGRAQARLAELQVAGW